MRANLDVTELYKAKRVPISNTEVVGGLNPMDPVHTKQYFVGFLGRGRAVTTTVNTFHTQASVVTSSATPPLPISR